MKTTRWNITNAMITGLCLFVALTATAFAQGNPTVTANPSALDFGIVEFDSPATRPVAVKNTSQQPIRIGGGSTNNGFNVTGGGGTQLLNPGQEKTVNVSCIARTATTVNAVVFITAGFANQTLKRVLDIPVKCTGVDPFFRFNLKMLQPSFSDFVDVQVTGDPTITQVKCAIPNDRDPFSGCDFRLRKGAKIRIQASAQNFQSFSNGSGAASICSGTAPCAFILNANSEVSANFKKPPAPKPTPPPTEFKVTLKKLGPGGGRVSIGPVGAVPINTDGLPNGQTVEGTFARGIRMRLNVNPDANSKIRSIVVSGASGCNGNSPCEFILSERVFVEVGFNKK